jgi:RNA polymerase sigma factor (sigma-70 family)
LEASAVAQASRRGLIGRRSPILRLQKDDRLVELIRDGHPCAFEVLFDRYQARLLAFCRNMLGSEQDAEDVLQEVFVAAHRAMLADGRYINVRPWLYRIARNRSLNHLRKPTAEGQDTMDDHVDGDGTTTAERVQHREELREVLRDVRHLPETQRTALLLREADGLSYNEIAQAMGTTVPAVKSLLVRARIALAEASRGRLLTCDEVRLTLAEAAEGIGKADGAVRQHVRRCGECKQFRESLDASTKALAALFPVGALAAFKALVAGKLGIGGSSAGGGATTSGALGGGAAGGGAAGGGVAAGGAAAGTGVLGGTLGGVAASGAGAGGVGGVIGGALGAKAAAGVATAAIVAAGAVEVRQVVSDPNASSSSTAIEATKASTPAPRIELKPESASVRQGSPHEASSAPPPDLAPAPATAPAPAEAPEPPPAPATTEASAPPEEPPLHEAAPEATPAAASSAVTETGTEPGAAGPDPNEETPLTEPSEPDPVVPPSEGKAPPSYDEGSVATPPPSSTPTGTAP